MEVGGAAVRTATRGPALRAPRAARVAGTSPAIPYGDKPFCPLASAALRLPFASPVSARAYGTSSTGCAARPAGLR